MNEMTFDEHWGRSCLRFESMNPITEVAQHHVLVDQHKWFGGPTHFFCGSTHGFGGPTPGFGESTPGFGGEGSG